jgi:two-component system phosphate regulon sensor histidine kinase PhoR
MAQTLRERIQKITEQRNQLQAILSSMVEGVIALNMEERIVSLNRAACEMLGLNMETACGLSIQEAVRDTGFQKVVSDINKGRSQLEERIVLRSQAQEKTLCVRGTVIYDDSGERVGMLIVLYDVTRVERLENIRQEFVANVSHELKTPITAIKGAVETLQEVAAHEPTEAPRFLQIIRRHSERLEAIVEDLLTLSRLEQEEIHRRIPIRETKLRELLASAIAACKEMAGGKGIRVELHCHEDLKAKVNANLLEQAVINLLDNAIKYSDGGKEIKVEAEKLEEKIEIRVEDQGWGIDKRHLPRIFERFYRVDKARSRSQGGTGLGLAIVKHVAQVHGGSVRVISKLGEGSIFYKNIPTSEEKDSVV